MVMYATVTTPVISVYARVSEFFLLTLTEKMNTPDFSQSLSLPKVE